MKVAQFIELINNPADLNENHLPDLERILADYPFFQSAHLLYAKALKNSKHINYHNALKRTAVIAGNRAVLYRLIHQQPKKEIPAQETITPKEEIIVTVPIITEPEEITIPVPVVEDKKEPVNDKHETVISTSFSIPANVVYNVVESQQEPRDKSQESRGKSQESGKEEQKTEELEVTKQETTKLETLDEIAIKPVVEAYVQTEILKITEKEPEIDINEPRSFTDWLKQVSVSSEQLSVSNKITETIIEKQETIKKEPKTPKTNILDKLLAEDLRISKPQPDKNFFAASQKTRSSVLEDENLVTETLAKIYVLQGNQQKAIRAYEILSLKFPEKSAYFAALITDLKNNVK